MSICDNCNKKTDELIGTDCMGEICQQCFTNFNTGNTYDDEIHRVKAVNPDAREDEYYD